MGFESPAQQGIRKSDWYNNRIQSSAISIKQHKSKLGLNFKVPFLAKSSFLPFSYHPLKAGEYVEAGGTAGTVESVQIFNTILISPDNKMIVVSNNNILSGNIINYTRTGKRRVDLTIGVSYSADLKKTRKVLENVLTNESRVLQEPAWTIGVCALADSSVNFVVRPWVKSSDYWRAYFNLYENIKTSLDEANIEIPFPQQDVHIISSNTES